MTTFKRPVVASIDINYFSEEFSFFRCKFEFIRHLLFQNYNATEKYEDKLFFFLNDYFTMYTTYNIIPPTPEMWREPVIKVNEWV